jgi:hypothetical protein
MIILNEESIQKESYSVGGGRINKTGAYTGFFTKAYEIVSAKTGSKAIHLEFVSDNGSSAAIDLWYWSGKTDALIDFQMDATVFPLLSLMGLKSLREKPNHSIEVWDFDVKGLVSKKFTAFPDLANKPIGVIFQMEEYQKNNGTLGEQARAFRFFDAKTRQTAKEKANENDAVAVELLLADLPDVKRLSLLSTQIVNVQDAQIIQKANDFDFDDDIVF